MWNKFGRRLNFIYSPAIIQFKLAQFDGHTCLIQLLIRIADKVYEPERQHLIGQIIGNTYACVQALLQLYIHTRMLYRNSWPAAKSGNCCCQFISNMADSKIGIDMGNDISRPKSIINHKFLVSFKPHLHRTKHKTYQTPMMFTMICITFPKTDVVRLNLSKIHNVQNFIKYQFQSIWKSWFSGFGTMSIGSLQSIYRKLRSVTVKPIILELVFVFITTHIS